MKPKTKKAPEAIVREIKRNTNRKFKPDEKIRIILEGIKGECLDTFGDLADPMCQAAFPTE